MLNLFSRSWLNLRYYLLGLYRRLDKHHAFLMSGGLAFSLFTCSIPFSFVLLAILSNLFARPEVEAEIFALIDRLVPYANQAAQIKEILADRFELISSVFEYAGIIGILALFIAATGLFSSMRTILNTIFRTKNVESVLVGKLWDFVLVIIILVITVILMVAIPALEGGFEILNKVNLLEQFSISGLDTIIFNLFSLLLLIIVFSAIFWLVPVYKPAWRAVFVGAMVSSLLWMIAKELFGYYISYAATLKHIYGVYTFVVISAFWIYYSALILIIGAEFGQLYDEKHKK